MIIIADTGPLHYLVLIHQADLLPRLFERVVLPPAVFAELQNAETPAPVRDWIANPPSWLKVQPLSFPPDTALDYLDEGEREAIALAEELKPAQVLLDESDARREASRRKLPFIGTLGVLRRAAHLGWIDLPSTLEQLQQTTFYVRAELIESLLAEDAARKKSSGEA